jgi:hypothetical protein
MDYATILENLENILLDKNTEQELVKACERGTLRTYLLPRTDEPDMIFPPDDASKPIYKSQPIYKLFAPLIGELFNAENFLWLVLMFYDEIRQDYFFFTFRNAARLGNNNDNSRFVKIHRAAEKQREAYRARILDVSDLLFRANVRRRQIHIHKEKEVIQCKVLQGESGGILDWAIPSLQQNEHKHPLNAVVHFGDFCTIADKLPENKTLEPVTAQLTSAMDGYKQQHSDLANVLDADPDFRKKHANYFLWLYSLSSKWTDYYVVFPLNPLTFNAGGIVLSATRPIPPETIALTRAYANRFYGFLSTAFARIISTRKSLSSATAAIISRNMSHNLGSHVLARHSGGWENKASVQSTVYNLESSTCSPTSSVYDSLEGAIDAVFKKQWTAIKDDQQLDRWLQARMDFVAQVATEWPRWVDSAQLVGEIIWGMLRQRVLLREIVASEGIGSHEWQPDGKTALDGCTGTDEDSKQASGKAIRLNCCKVSLDRRPKKDKGPPQACALRNGHCILCIPPDGEPTVNLANDIAVAIPGGLTGWHAFYVILENIIRNAAKHQNSGATGKDGAEPLNIYIEILDDSTGKIHIENRPEEAGWPAWLVRVYDNISVLKKGKRLVTTTNDKLNEPIIDASGGLNREHWGLAEMKIAAAYLQRRDLARLGEGGQSVTGNVKAPLHKGTQGSAIIRAVKSPLNTLGYEFFLLKPTRLAIAHANRPKRPQAESPNERS